METLTPLVLQQSASSFASFDTQNSDKILLKTTCYEEASEEKSSIKESKAIELESSVMRWFKEKGIETGCPSELLEAHRTLALKNIVSHKE